MKKLLALLLALTMVLALCACGGNQEKEAPEETTEASREATEEPKLNKNSAEAYLGTWEYKTMRLIVNKGGVGRYEHPDPFNGKIVHHDFEYEIKDGVMVICMDTFQGKFYTVSELSDDGTSLIIIQDGLPWCERDFVEGESAFEKK